MKTKFSFFYLFSACFLASFATSNAQAPAWSWVRGAVGTANESGYAVASDASGNVYVAGSFSSPSIDFGTGSISNVGASDGFLVKYDASGTVLWIKVYAGNMADGAWAVALDPSGNAIVGGSFRSDSIDLGQGMLYNDSAGTEDIFFAKYDGAGNILWTKKCGSSKDEEAMSMATDAVGNIYVGGFFKSNSLSFDTVTVIRASYADMYLLKMDSAGNALWAKTGSGYSEGKCISVDGTGNISLAGDFEDASMTLDATTLVNSDGVGNTSDLFLAKYTSNGNLLWVKGFGGNDFDEILGMSTDLAGSSYLTGDYISSSIDFDTISLANNSFGGAGDYYFAKYDNNGDALWANYIPEGNAIGYAVATDHFGNTYVAGSFVDSATFGSIVLHADTSLASDFPLFLTRYSFSGNPVWAKRISGDSYENIRGLACDPAGNVYMTGEYYCTDLLFDSLSLTNSIPGITDFFLAKLGIPCHAYYTIQPDTAPNSWIVIDYASGAAPLTYSWSWGDGNTSPGATPTHIYAGPGNYNICQTITDANGCGDTYCDSSTYLNRPGSVAIPVSVTVISSLPTGLVNPRSPENVLSVYPNPASSRVTITGASLNSTFSIVDVAGKLIASGQPNATAFELDLGGLNKGIYFLLVTDEAGTMHKKIIKE